MTEIQSPLFPLPIVLFPGMPQLLHIFEPRYRDMLADCLAGERRFGLSFLDTERRPERGEPAPGDVGCLARIRSHQPLADGRSNILAVGDRRFEIREVIVGAKPYFIGRVEVLEDRPDAGTDLSELAERVRGSFRQLHALLIELSDSLQPPADLPDDPAQLTFQLAGALDIPPGQKEQLLRATSVRVRLELLEGLLRKLTRQVKPQVATHQLAKRNGRAGPLPKLPTAG